jgi:deaminated glutathione amidase
MRVAAIQTTAGPDRDTNLGAAGELVEEAAAGGASLVVLPEYFSVAGSPDHLRSTAEDMGGPTTTWASHLARRLRIHLLAGTFPERATGAAPSDKISNTSCLVDPSGSIRAVYRKIHLFDVALSDTTFCESATVAPGADLCLARLDGPPELAGLDGPPVLGLSVCYDLRFPELYRILALRGATVIVVPSAFTAATGPAHWELLLRARAVENEVFVIGAGQVGKLPPGMPSCHGHSMIVDAWGSVLAERSEPTPGVVLAELDWERQRTIRSELPVLANRRPAAYRWPRDDWRGRTGPDS